MKNLIEDLDIKYLNIKSIILFPYSKICIAKNINLYFFLFFENFKFPSLPISFN